MADSEKTLLPQDSVQRCNAAWSEWIKDAQPGSPIVEGFEESYRVAFMAGFTAGGIDAREQSEDAPCTTGHSVYKCGLPEGHDGPHVHEPKQANSGAPRVERLSKSSPEADVFYVYLAEPYPGCAVTTKREQVYVDYDSDGKVIGIEYGV